MTTHRSMTGYRLPAPTLVASGGDVLDVRDGVLCPPVRAEPVGTRQEVRLEDRFQDQFQCRLNDPIRHGRYP